MLTFLIGIITGIFIVKMVELFFKIKNNVQQPDKKLFDIDESKLIYGDTIEVKATSDICKIDKKFDNWNFIKYYTLISFADDKLILYDNFGKNKIFNKKFPFPSSIEEFNELILNKKINLNELEFIVINLKTNEKITIFCTKDKKHHESTITALSNFSLKEREKETAIMNSIQNFTVTSNINKEIREEIIKQTQIDSLTN